MASICHLGVQELRSWPPLFDNGEMSTCQNTTNVRKAFGETTRRKHGDWGNTVNDGTFTVSVQAIPTRLPAGSLGGCSALPLSAEQTSAEACLEGLSENEYPLPALERCQYSTNVRLLLTNRLG